MLTWLAKKFASLMCIMARGLNEAMNILSEGSASRNKKRGIDYWDGK